MNDGLEQKVANLEALLRRGVMQLRAWHGTYGAHQPAWLPPAGDVRWLEDVTAELDALAAIPPVKAQREAPGATRCPGIDTRAADYCAWKDEWDMTHAYQPAEGDAFDAGFRAAWQRALPPVAGAAGTAGEACARICESLIPQNDVSDWTEYAIIRAEAFTEAAKHIRATLPPTPPAAGTVGKSLQQRVEPWLMACFGAEIAGDTVERNHRFLEESLELVQACGCTASEAHQLVDYTYGRPVGEKHQEAGGVMITLAALCRAQGIDMHEQGEVELARIWTMVEKIRAKQAAKPKHSPLPALPPTPPAAGTVRVEWLTEVEAELRNVPGLGDKDVEVLTAMASAGLDYADELAIRKAERAAGTVPIEAGGGKGCQRCGGEGSLLNHPSLIEPTRKCPDCKGTGYSTDAAASQTSKEKNHG